MVAYVIFTKERTRNQQEIDLYRDMAGAALAGHPITFRVARLAARKSSKARTARRTS